MRISIFPEISGKIVLEISELPRIFPCPKWHLVAILRWLAKKIIVIFVNASDSDKDSLNEKLHQRPAPFNGYFLQTAVIVGINTLSSVQFAKIKNDDYVYHSFREVWYNLACQFCNTHFLWCDKLENGLNFLKKLTLGGVTVHLVEKSVFIPQNSAIFGHFLSIYSGLADTS